MNRKRNGEPDEERCGGEPPAAREPSRERHHDDEREADEQELGAELEPVREERLDVAAVGLVVAAVPPDLREAERHLRDPDEGEPDHPEQHPRADPAGRRLLGEADAVLGVEHEHAEQDELRDDELDPEEELVAVGPRRGCPAGSRPASRRPRTRSPGTTLCQSHQAATTHRPASTSSDDCSHHRARVRQIASGSSGWGTYCVRRLGLRRRAQRRARVRIVVGDDEPVRVRLRVVADGERAEVAKPGRHPAGHERGEPAEEGDDEEHAR